MSGSLEKLFRKRPRRLEIDGDEFFLRPLTVAEYLILRQIDEANWLDVCRFMLSRCLVEADGTQVFTDETDERLNGLPLNVLGHLHKQALSLTNGGSVEGLKKSSAETPNSGSS